jgi:hypothetical protein
VLSWAAAASPGHPDVSAIRRPNFLPRANIYRGSKISGPIAFIEGNRFPIGISLDASEGCS